MQVTVLLFGPLREAAGAKTLEMRLPEGATVADLHARLAERFPAVEGLGDRLRIAVGRELAEPTAPLGEGAEVALLPPVSGGAQGPPRRCTLSAEALDPAEVSARVAGPDAGGLVSFSGAVREHSRGHEIRRLEYEAYAEMAEGEMERIAAEAAERFPGARVAIAHRVGALAVGELAVVVAAAAAHRAEAFDAARYAIDALKERVPIWKKEVAADGAWWVDDHA